MKTKRVKQSYTINPDAVEGLKELATNLQVMRSGKPNVSRLIEGIGLGLFHVSNPHTSPSLSAIKQASIQQLEQTIVQLQSLLDTIREA